MYNFLIDLLNKKISIAKAKKEQNEMAKKTNSLETFVSLEENSIKEEQSKSAIERLETKKSKEKRLFHHKRKNAKMQKICMQQEILPLKHS